MKMAGKSSASYLARGVSALAGPQRFTRAETKAMNRQALAVIPHADEFGDESPFFASPTGGASSVTGGELSLLDSMIDKHGLGNVLKAVQGLLESRIEEGMAQGGRVLLHLSRDDAFARAAERLRDLAFHPDVSEL